MHCNFHSILFSIVLYCIYCTVLYFPLHCILYYPVLLYTIHPLVLQGYVLFYPSEGHSLHYIEFHCIVAYFITIYDIVLYILLSYIFYYFLLCCIVWMIALKTPVIRVNSNKFDTQACLVAAGIFSNLVLLQC